MVATSNFLLPNATFFAELFAFLFVLGVLAKWVLPPLKAAMEKRQAEIKESIENAQHLKEDAQALEEKLKREIEEAKAESRRIVSSANAQAAQLKEEGRERGQVEYERLVQAAHVDIEQEKQRVRDELTKEFGQLVVVAAEKIIGSELDASKHSKLIEETISRAGETS